MAESNELGFELKVNGVEQAILILENLKGTFESVKGGFESAKTTLKDLGSAFTEMATGVDLSTTSMAALNTVLAASGIGLIVIALASLVSYFKDTADGADEFAGIMTALKVPLDAVREVLDLIGKGISKFIDVIISLSPSMSKAAEGAKELSKAHRELEEKTHSVNVELKTLEGQNSTMLRQLRDTSISYKERIAIADKLIANIQKEGDIKKELAITNVKLLEQELDYAMANGESEMAIKKKIDALNDATASYNQIVQQTNTDNAQAKARKSIVEKQEESQEKAKSKKAEEKRKKIYDDQVQLSKQLQEESDSARQQEYDKLEDAWNKKIQQAHGNTQLLAEINIQYAKDQAALTQKFNDQDAKADDDLNKQKLKDQADALKQQEQDQKAWYDSALLGAKGNYIQLKSITADYYNTEIALAGKNKDKIIELETQKTKALDKLKDEEKKADEKRARDAIKEATTFVSNLESIDKSLTDSKKNQLEAQKNQELSVKGLTKSQVDAINKKYAAEEEKDAKADFERTKALNIAKAVISTASAIVGFLANPGGQIGVVESVAAAIAGGIQIATIAAQQYISADTSSSSAPQGSTYATGGYLNGPSHAGGGIPLVAEGGESIINKQSTAMHKGLLSAINASGGGKNFAPKEADQFLNGNTQAPSKVYVVASDMTSQQEATNRIQQLAKL